MLVNPRGALVLLPLLALGASPATHAADSPTNVNETWGRVPLQFEENRAGEAVRFFAHGPGYGLHLTSTDAVLVLAKSAVNASDETSVALRMSVVGARSTTAMTGVDELPGKANYFIGNDPSQWRTNVPTYAKVRYSGIYPGIDLVYYGQQRQLEYDFVVAPGADPNQIALGFTGANDLEIDAHGELVLHTAAGDVRQHKPVVYQETDGIRHEIEGSYVRKGETGVGFNVAEYDRALPLVIDPVLVYSTYLGGSKDDTARAVAIDAVGSVYITGQTHSDNFPSTPGALHSPPGTGNAVFVTKLDATGSTVLYSTYFGGGGGSRTNIPYGIALDPDRNAYVTGSTDSQAFPTTAGAFQATGFGNSTAFVTKLDATGSTLLYSTYLGRGFYTLGHAIAIDSDRNAYVTGYSTDSFPTTQGAFQTNFPGPPFSFPNPRGQGGQENPGIFVSKLDATGSSLVYSTWLGLTAVSPNGDPGTAPAEAGGIAVNSAGEAYIVGNAVGDFPTTPGAFQTAKPGVAAFVTKFNSAGSALVYSTFLGGQDASTGGNTFGAAIAIDVAGHAYVTGTTLAEDFPVTPGAFQTHAQSIEAFVTKLEPSGSALVYSTFVGGMDKDYGRAIAIDVDGNAYITGYTSSTDFPLTPDACQLGFQGGIDAFSTKLNPAGSAVLYSTYLGGSGVDRGEAIAVDTGGTAFVAGETGPVLPFGGVTCPDCTDGTDDFPATARAFQGQYGGGERDGFVVKIAQPVQPAAAPPATSTDTSSSPTSAATPVADSGNQSSGSGGGGGAFDWLTLSALLAAVGLARKRRAGP